MERIIKMDLMVVGLSVVVIGGISYAAYTSLNNSNLNVSDNEEIVNTNGIDIIYNRYKNKFSDKITLDMLYKMWEIESARGNPSFMFRPESGLAASQKKWSLYNGTNVSFDDASLGDLQVLTGTANWLYTDMGYRDEGKPTLESLKQTQQNTYFAMAYLDWLAKRGKRSGINVTEKFLVMSYNGGYGANNAQTRNHYNKYLKAKGV